STIASLITSGSVILADITSAEANKIKMMPTSLFIGLLLFYYHRSFHIHGTLYSQRRPIHRSQFNVIHLPIARVLDRAGDASLGYNVDKGHVDDRPFRKPGSRKDFARARCFHVLNPDVAKLAKPSLRRSDRRAQDQPMRRYIRQAGWQLHITVGRI